MSQDPKIRIKLLPKDKESSAILKKKRPQTTLEITDNFDSSDGFRKKKPKILLVFDRDDPNNENKYTESILPESIKINPHKKEALLNKKSSSVFLDEPLKTKSYTMKSLALLSMENIYSYIDSDINNFLSLWIKIDLPEGITNESILNQIKTYLLGISYIIEKYSPKSWQRAFNDDKIAVTNGLYILFSFTLNQIEVGSKNKRKNDVVVLCLDIEMSFLQIISLILKKTASRKKFIYGDSRILGCIFQSINSTNPTARICSLSILKLLLKNTSFHHMILTSLKQLAHKYNLPFKVFYLTRHYEKEDRGSNYNMLLAAVINIILRSKSPSPYLDSWKREIKKYCEHLISDLEPNDEKDDIDDTGFWKNKFFNLHNDTDEIKDMKSRIKDYEDKMAKLKKDLENSIENEKKTKEHYDKAVDFNNEMKRALMPIKSMCIFDEIEIDENFFQKLKSELEKFKGAINTINVNQTNEDNLNDGEEGDDKGKKKGKKLGKKDKDRGKNSNQRLSKFVTDEGKKLGLQADKKSKKGDQLIPSEDNKASSSTSAPAPPPLPPGGAPGAPPSQDKFSFLKTYNVQFSPELIKFATDFYTEMTTGKVLNLPFLPSCPLKPEDISSSNVYKKDISLILEKSDVEKIYLKFAKDTKKLMFESAVQVETVKDVLPKKTTDLANFVMKKVKRSATEISEIILSGNLEEFGEEDIAVLSKLTPTSEMLKSLESANKKGTLESNTDLFVYTIWKTPETKSIIKFGIFLLNGMGEIKNVEKKVNMFMDIFTSLIPNDQVDKLLTYIIAAMNLINMQKKRPCLNYIDIKSLIQLFDIKSNDGKTNLLSYIIKEFKEKIGSIDTFGKIVEMIGSNLNLSIVGIKLNFNELYDELENAESLILSLKNFEKYREFYKKTLETITPLNEKFANVQEYIPKIRANYCFDPKVDIEEDLLDFHNFLSKVKIIAEAKEEKK